MTSCFTRLLPRFAVLLASLLLLCAPARAGLITGNWDPTFGTFLPGLGWQVRVELQVPNACSAQGDGTYDTTVYTDPCFNGGITLQHLWMRLYDIGIADPNDFFTQTANSQTADFAPYYSSSSLSSMRVTGGQISGFVLGPTPVVFGTAYVNCNPYPTNCGPVYSWPTTSGGNPFGLIFTLDGPEVQCFQCRHNLSDPPGGSIITGDKTDLKGFITTYDSNDTSHAKQTDSNGNALGLKLDSHGTVLGLSNSINGPITSAVVVPEPMGVLLSLTALAGALLARRRRG